MKKRMKSEGISWTDIGIALVAVALTAAVFSVGVKLGVFVH